MTQTLAVDPDIVTGDPVTLQFDVVINGSVVATANPSTVIRCAIVSRDKKSNLCPTESPGYVVATLTSGNPTTGKWSATFTGNQTAELLSTPGDLTSDFVSAVKRSPDTTTDTTTGATTGFGTALLEIQVGAPYQLRTKHSLITIGKGLIP